MFHITWHRAFFGDSIVGQPVKEDSLARVLTLLCCYRMVAGHVVHRGVAAPYRGRAETRHVLISREK